MKSYKSIGPERLDSLRKEAEDLLGTTAVLELSVQTIYWLVSEVIDSREEITQLTLASSLESTLSEELDDDEEDHLAFKWPPDAYLACDMVTGSVYKPAFPCTETVRLPVTPSEPIRSDFEGRRLPQH